MNGIYYTPIIYNSRDIPFHLRTCTMSTTAPVSAMTTIRFEDGPAADASGATIMCSDAGIRITFSTGETRYYYGLGAHVAESATIRFGTIPELQGPNAPKPSAELQAKYKNRHTGVGAVGRAKITVGDGTATSAVAAGAVGYLCDT